MTSDCLPHQAVLEQRDAQRERNAALKQRVKARMDVARLAVAAEVPVRPTHMEEKPLGATRMEEISAPPDDTETYQGSPLAIFQESFRFVAVELLHICLKQPRLMADSRRATPGPRASPVQRLWGRLLAMNSTAGGSLSDIIEGAMLELCTQKPLLPAGTSCQFVLIDTEFLRHDELVENLWKFQLMIARPVLPTETRVGLSTPHRDDMALSTPHRDDMVPTPHRDDMVPVLTETRPLVFWRTIKVL